MRNIFNIHNFKPILSRYITFTSRDIIYECKCGKKEERNVRKAYGDPFPIETSVMLTRKDYIKALNS